MVGDVAFPVAHPIGHDRKGRRVSRAATTFVETDIAMLDRVRPERSFQTPRPADREPAEAFDDVDQLERLGALRERGLLTDEEFRAAKARLLG
jgi:hypothetical protein